MTTTYVSYIKELLDPFGVIKTRQMFGGVGIYRNGAMFAIIVNDELYFKADEIVAKTFQSYGSEQFAYQRDGKTVKMSYWRVVPEVLEEEEILQKWVNMSCSISTSSKK